MRLIRSARAAVAAIPIESIGPLLGRHRAATRVALAALSLIVVIALGQQAATQAGPEQPRPVAASILPQSVGAAVSTDRSITIPFDVGMDPASVEVALRLLPGPAPVQLAWNSDRTALTLTPDGRWRTDASYLVVIGATSRTADGATLSEPRRFAFTTESAPAIAGVEVRLATADLPPAEETGLTTRGASAVVLDDATEAAVAGGSEGMQVASQPPTSTPRRVSATSPIKIAFSDPMDTADVEDHFVITPHVDGALSWSGGDLVFTPTDRLVAGARYTISLIGSHDRTGNLLGGKGNVSFIVKPAAQLLTTAPKPGATDAEPATVEMWFSQPMDLRAAGSAFAVTDASTGSAIDGRLDWDETGTRLSFVPDAALAAGSTIEVAFGEGARDADGNLVGMAWSFTTPAAPAPEPAPSAAAPPAGTAPPAAAPPPASSAPPPAPPPAPAASAAGHAVNQINASRAAYGFGPVVLDAAISAVAYAHAYDQAINGYFSHTGLNGSTRESRLRAGGIGFGWSGENQCYLVGRSVIATLDWCHSAFMAEPYPGHWNHIANVLNPNARRVGVGIAQVGSKIVVVWDFTD